MNKKITLGIALLLPALVQAQSPVTTAGQKYALIEESTGVWCGYCPDGSIIVDNILAAQPKAIAVAIHDNNNSIAGDGNANDMMEIAEGHTYINTTGYCNGFPNGSVDRVPGSNGKVGQSRSLWSSMTTTALANTPKFDITVKHMINNTTDTLSIWVYAKTLSAITGSFNINAYITEDSIPSTGTGYGQISYFYNTTTHPLYLRGVPNSSGSSAVLGVADYTHKHVLRAMLGGTFGTTGVIATNAASGVTYMKKYKVYIPPTWKKKHLHIIGMAMKHNTADVNDRAIDNAIEAKLDTNAVVTEINDVYSSISDAEVFPNPASTSVTITATLNEAKDAHITLVNTVGQTVYSREVKNTGVYINENIETSNLSNGIYIVNISMEGASITKKLIINN